MGARFSRNAQPSKGKTSDDASPPSADHSSPPSADHSMLPPIDREATALSEKEGVLEMTFMLENMRMKEWAAADENRAACFERVDNSGFEYDPETWEPPALPLDDDGFVQAFDVDEGEAINAFFEWYGLVVVRDVIDADACARSLDELWAGLETNCKGLQRDDPSTYGSWPSLAKLGILGNTFLLSPQWCANRQSPRVHRAFAALFGTERLVVNVGRASAMRPTRGVPTGGPSTAEGRPALVDRPEWRSKAGPEWLHWDMNPFTGAASSFSWRVRRPLAARGYGRLRVQGLVALSECGPDDGGFFCVPGSHAIVRGWARRNAAAVPDASVMSAESSIQLPLPLGDPLKAQGAKAPVRAGSLLVWDARLAHCNFPNDSANMRVVQYIQAAEADDPAIGPLCTDERLLPPRDQFEPTPLGRRLYGFDPWP